MILLILRGFQYALSLSAYIIYFDRLDKHSIILPSICIVLYLFYAYQIENKPIGDGVKLEEIFQLYSVPNWFIF